MTKSELIERLATQQSHIPAKTVEDAVKEMLEHMASTLAQGNAATKLVKEYKKRQSSIGYAGACRIESDWREVCYLLFLP